MLIDRVAARYCSRAWLLRPSRRGESRRGITEEMLAAVLPAADLGRQILALEGEEVSMAVSLAYLRDEGVGEMLLGSPRFQEARTRAGARAEGNHLMLEAPPHP